MLNFSKRHKMKKIGILFSLTVLMALTGCQDLTELNDNPNNVTETHPQLLLTNIASNAFEVDGTGALYASRILVQTDGEKF